MLPHHHSRVQSIGFSMFVIAAERQSVTAPQCSEGTRSELVTLLPNQIMPRPDAPPELVRG